jgi:PPOX class probable FMN-dependent enzyme
MAHRLTDQTIDDEATLRALLGGPAPVVCSKIADRLNRLTRPFIERAPLAFLATSGRDGTCDVSPRGDPSGVARILDDMTLLLPERPGNRIADSLRNILLNPRVGLLFIVPGAGETFRVNGRATITTDVALLAPSTVEGKAPRLGILVDIEEAYTHCPKAFLRSDFWNPQKFSERATLPSNGAIQRELVGQDFDANAYDAERAARYARREGFF